MGPEASVYVYNNGQENYTINFAQLTQKDGSFLLGREKIDNFDYFMLKVKNNYWRKKRWYARNDSWTCLKKEWINNNSKW